MKSPKKLKTVSFCKKRMPETPDRGDAFIIAQIPVAPADPHLQFVSVGATRVAEKHFVNADCPRSRRLADLDDILVRSIKLTEGFIDFAKKRHMKIDEGVIRNYIIDYYASKGNEVVPDCPMQIPEREPGNHRAFYDDAPYGLKAIKNRILHERYAYVSFLSDSAASSPAAKKERSH